MQIRKSGLPFRLHHRAFFHQYRCLLPGNERNKADVAAKLVTEQSKPPIPNHPRGRKGGFVFEHRDKGKGSLKANISRVLAKPGPPSKPPPPKKKKAKKAKVQADYRAGSAFLVGSLLKTLPSLAPKADRRKSRSKRGAVPGQGAQVAEAGGGRSVYLPLILFLFFLRD